MKKFINITLGILDAELLDGGKAVADEAAEIRALAIELGWIETPPDPHDPRWNQLILSDETDEEKILALRLANPNQTVIATKDFNESEIAAFRAINEKFEADYQAACAIAKEPRFFIEDKFAEAIRTALREKRGIKIPTDSQQIYQQIFDEQFDIA